MRMRFGVLISGNGSTLQSILDCHDLINISVVVASKASAYGILRARRAGVPVEILPDHFKGAANREAAENWIIETLKKYSVQKIFLAGYMRLVSQKFLTAFNDEVYNIHPSLLPKYKGLDSLQAAIDAGDSVAGVTIHKVTHEMDSGETLSQRMLDIPSHRDSNLSHLWLHINEQRMIRETLRKIIWLDRQIS